jgi:hypothetical protein
MTLLTITVIVLALAAIGGWFVGIRHLLQKDVGIVLGIGHGVAAAAGVVLLIVAMAEAISGTLVLVALILFLGSSLGGFLLFTMHLKRRPLPMMITLGHGVATTTAFVLVLIRVVQVA